MYRGYIKHWRCLKEWEWYTTPHMVHLFMHLVAEANYETKRWQGITIERGQLVIGRKSLSLQTGIPEKSLRTCLDRLAKTGEIRLQPTNRFTVITVLSYEKYQSPENCGPAVGPTTGQQLANNWPQQKKAKKEKKAKNTYVGQETPISETTKTVCEFIEATCNRHGIENKVNPSALNVQILRHESRVRFNVEIQKCVTWLLDNGKRELTTMRLANWFEKSREIQKREEVKQLERNQTKNDPHLKQAMKASDADRSVAHFLAANES